LNRRTTIFFSKVAAGTIGHLAAEMQHWPNSGSGHDSGGGIMHVRFDVAMHCRVRAAGAAGFGAGAERLVHDLLDGAHAAAALGATAETPVDLTWGARRFRSTDGVSNVVIAENVTGTNNHGMKAAR
jgi:hypothetical protein